MGFDFDSVLRVPARHLFALELGHQCLSQVLRLPETLCLLCISGMGEQGHRSPLLEVILLEGNAAMVIQIAAWAAMRISSASLCVFIYANTTAH